MSAYSFKEPHVQLFNVWYVSGSSWCMNLQHKRQDTTCAGNARVLLFWHRPVIPLAPLLIVIAKNQFHFIAMWSNFNMGLVELMTRAEQSCNCGKLKLGMSHHHRHLGLKIGPKRVIWGQYNTIMSRLETLCHFQGLLTQSSALKAVVKSNNYFSK